MVPEFTGQVLFQPSFAPRPEISHVLFDFDGTLSLIRQGWPEVMVPMFVEALPASAGRDRGRASRGMVLDDIMRLNGKQTIYQMIQLAERIRERGGEPSEPLWYKHEYLRRLEPHIGDRHRRAAAADDPARRLARPRRPAAAGAPSRTAACRSTWPAAPTRSPSSARPTCSTSPAYFGGHIYGALDDYKQFSKKIVIDRILREHGITGRHLLSFGDGYVEIENTKQAGGLAVAVASDEANNGSGRVDEWKRERLLGRRRRRRHPRLSRRRSPSWIICSAD